MLLAALVLGGCSGGSTASPKPKSAIVLGTLALKTRVNGTPLKPIPGSITFTAPSHVYHVHANASGLFGTSLPTGTYTVSGSSPDYKKGTGRCSGGNVIVGSGSNTVVVTCVVD